MSRTDLPNFGSDPHWTDPTPEEVVPGVHRVPLPLPMDGLRAVNVYVIETDSGLTCIDGGWAVAESRTQLETSLNAIGHRLEDITRFLVTHVHRDHYTQAVAVRAEFGRATVELGIGEKPSIDMFHSPELDSDPTVDRLRVAGAHDVADRWHAMFAGRDLELAQWAAPDRWLDGEHDIEVGDRVLRAVPTPGHTAGHFVFADEAEGVLFAGDHVLPTITPSVGFELVFADDPLGDFLGSLHRVRELPDLRLLPAHGAVAESSHQRVDELLAHHDHRLDLCIAAVDPAGSSAYDVAQRLTWTRHERHFDELDVFNGAMATMETLVHLDLLVRRGRLSVDEVDGARVYRPLP
ncbi:MBL fold metallo-hydrolase [Nocardioides caldifontis]|uniref:MBL fold metallo-hydrolase n=1 Tax=Nocardioides caldifontis TaxID=2588938 RepID=UPI003B8463A0